MPPEFDGYAFAAQLLPTIPRFWEGERDDQGRVVCTAQQCFEEQMQTISVRREIELRTHNCRSAEATNRQLWGEIGRLQHRLDTDKLNPLDRQVIEGQRDVLLEDVRFNQVQMARWAIEIQMFCALTENMGG